MTLTIVNAISAIVSFMGMCYVYLIYIPHFSRFLIELQAKLPYLTILGLNISNYMQSYLFVIVGIIILFIAILWKINSSLLKYISPLVTMTCVFFIVIGLFAIDNPIMEIEKLTK